MSDEQPLCPAQQRAFDQLAAGLEIGALLHLRGGMGHGKTTVLKALHQRIGGAFLGMKDFMEASARNHPFAVEETAYMLVLGALKSHPVVILDDVHLLDMSSCMFGPRPGLFNTMMMGLCSYAIEAQQKIIFSTAENLTWLAEQRSYSFGIGSFGAEDYAALAASWLGPERARRVDFEKVFRFAPKLNAHQLKGACCWLARSQELNTDVFIELLRSQRLASNVHLSEAQAALGPKEEAAGRRQRFMAAALMAQQTEDS